MSTRMIYFVSNNLFHISGRAHNITPTFLNTAYPVALEHKHNIYRTPNKSASYRRNYLKKCLNYW